MGPLSDFPRGRSRWQPVWRRAAAWSHPTNGRSTHRRSRTIVGCTLFLRSRRGLVLTAAAHDLVPHAEVMGASHAALLRAASGETRATHGTVRITASEIMSTEVLPDILRTICDQNPALVIEIVPSNEVQNLPRRRHRCAYAAPQTDGARCQAYRHHAGRPLRPPQLHRTPRLPADLVDLMRHRLIGSDHYDTSFRSAVDALGSITRELSLPLRH